MKKIFFIILGVILIIAAISNPSKGQHVEKIKEEMYDLLSKSSHSMGGLVKAGSGLLGPMVDKIVSPLVRVDNYVFFSITKVRVDSNFKTVGFGAFGNVFLKLDKLYEHALNNEDGLDAGMDHDPGMHTDGTALTARDSVQLLYNDALAFLDSLNNVAPSLKTEEGVIYDEIAGYKGMVSAILANKNVGAADLKRARALLKKLNSSLYKLEIKAIQKPVN